MEKLYTVIAWGSVYGVVCLLAFVFG